MSARTLWATLLRKIMIQNLNITLPCLAMRTLSRGPSSSQHTSTARQHLTLTPTSLSVNHTAKNFQFDFKHSIYKIFDMNRRVGYNSPDSTRALLCLLSTANRAG